jgi:hypothetical protein
MTVMATAVPGSARVPGPSRVLRLEIKRSVVPWVLPLLAALFYFDTIRTASGLPPVWTLRASAITDHMLNDFDAFGAGLAAWVGSREGRRKTGDLVAATPRAAWARQAAALGGTAFWLLLAFLAGVAVLYVQTGLQATWGGPPLWPVFVGVADVIVVTVFGFTCGTLFPGRFTAPLVAIAIFLLDFAGFHAALNVTAGSSTYGLLAPDTSPPPVDAGVFYHGLPDVPIAQVMFMGGITLALLGVLGLAPVLRKLASRGWPVRGTLVDGDGWWLRAIAVVLLAAGVAASWTAYSLAGTAKLTATGWEIPALHDAASDEPVPFVPDCTSGPDGFRVCVHPAFSGYLSDVAAALDPVAAEIAGLPGAPVRAEQVASVGTGPGGFEPSYIAGNPAVFDYNGEQVGDLFGGFRGIPAGAGPFWRAAFQQGLLDSFLAEPPHPAAAARTGLAPLGAAQQAVEDALMIAVGSQPPQDAVQGGQSGGPSQAQITAAARRFAALSPSARHAWLAAHLRALESGQITLGQLP